MQGSEKGILLNGFHERQFGEVPFCRKLNIKRTLLTGFAALQYSNILRPAKGLRPCP